MTDEKQNDLDDTTEAAPDVPYAPFGIDIRLAPDEIETLIGPGTKPGDDRPERERKILEFGLEAAFTIIANMKKEGRLGVELEGFGLGEVLAAAYVVVTRDMANVVMHRGKQHCGWCVKANKPDELRSSEDAERHVLTCSHNPAYALAMKTAFVSTYLVSVVDDLLQGRATDQTALKDAIEMVRKANDTIESWTKGAPSAG